MQNIIQFKIYKLSRNWRSHVPTQHPGSASQLQTASPIKAAAVQSRVRIPVAKGLSWACLQYV
jgi:hypothetical protein